MASPWLHRLEKEARRLFNRLLRRFNRVRYRGSLLKLLDQAQKRHERRWESALADISRRLDRGDLPRSKKGRTPEPLGQIFEQTFQRLKGRGRP
jgi:hypothetical protein